MVSARLAIISIIGLSAPILLGHGLAHSPSGVSQSGGGIVQSPLQDARNDEMVKYPISLTTVTRLDKETQVTVGVKITGVTSALHPFGVHAPGDPLVFVASTANVVVDSDLGQLSKFSTFGLHAFAPESEEAVPFMSWPFNEQPLTIKISPIKNLTWGTVQKKEHLHIEVQALPKQGK